MSRITWGGTLYGQPQDDPPESRREIVERTTHLFACPICPYSFSDVDPRRVEIVARHHYLEHQRGNMRAEAAPQIPTAQPANLIDAAKRAAEFVERTLKGNLDALSKKPEPKQLPAKTLKLDKDGVYKPEGE